MRALAAVLAVATLAACSGSSNPAPARPSAPEQVAWLCRPDTADPCERSRASTAGAYGGSKVVEPPIRPAAGRNRLDCFYVYPTVSAQQSSNADLTVEREERDVAFAQASRFSDVCRVWAPVYRQRTIESLSDLEDTAADSAANRTALASLTAACRDYLAHGNDGRPIVFIGHSQGAAMLMRMMRTEVDPVPSVRARTALAILLGSNVTVKTGRLVGGTFRHLPLCHRTGERGCVIAYSSFADEPPPFSFFGRPGLGVSVLSGETADGTTRVACVNPAALGGGRAGLHPYFPTALAGSGADTPWTSIPGTYDAECRTAGTATWLQVTPVHEVDARARLSESMGRPWGLHVYDVSLALGDLVDDVRAVAARL
jgi:hypothetical protein